MNPKLTIEQRDEILKYLGAHKRIVRDGGLVVAWAGLVDFLVANTEESIMCNQFPEKECYNKDGNRCKTCEYQSLCLCTRIDRPHIEEQPKQESKKCPECGGAGEVDSGEIPKDGTYFMEICPKCKGSGKNQKGAIK